MTQPVCWFDDAVRQRVVSEAVQILEEIGLAVENDAAFSLLREAGARIDQRRVYLNGALVTRALETAPRRVLLYNRNGQAAMDLGANRLHFNPGSAALRILDHETGQVRTPTTADLVRLARLTDALPNYAAQSTGLVPGDVPGEIADSYRLYIALLHSAKPVVTGTFRRESFRVMHEMLAAVAGSPDRLRSRPIAIFDCCPTAPLQWTDLTAQALIDCAIAGIPAEIVSTPLAGATAPVTLAGTVTQHCAENLGGVVIHQLAAPGAPVIYGGCASCFDMRRGTTPLGSVETVMLQTACAEIGRHLGLPTHGYLALSDSKQTDYQAGMETAMGAVLAALSGVNNVSGPGMLESAACQSLEKLCLDHELCGMALRLACGIALRDDPLAMSVIPEGLERREFLSLDHTLRWFRHEVCFPDPVIDRATRDEWQRSGGKDAEQRAAERVRQLLAHHEIERPAPEIADPLTELIEHEAKRAGLNRLPAQRD